MHGESKEQADRDYPNEVIVEISFVFLNGVERYETI